MVIICEKNLFSTKILICAKKYDVSPQNSSFDSNMSNADFEKIKKGKNVTNYGKNDNLTENLILFFCKNWIFLGVV